MKSKFKQFLTDAAVAVALCAALLAVVGVDALLNWLRPPASIAAPVNDATAPKVVHKAKTLRLAVTRPYREKLFGAPGETWDEIGILLASLGEGYRNFDVIDEAALQDLAKLKQYDVVFCCCSAVEPEEQAAKALRSYVSEGGTLYASDWRYGLVARAFPEMRPAPERPAGQGLTIKGPDGMARLIMLPSTLPNDGVIITNKGIMNTEVLDDGLRSALEAPALLLNFEMPFWKQAAFQDSRVKVLLRTRSLLYKAKGGDSTGGDRGGGTLRKSDDLASEQEVNIPLLVQFRMDKGTVIFTSYHHGKSNSHTEQQVLKYLIFKLVTSSVETHVEDILEKNQFSPVKSNLFSASKDNPAVSKSYHNPEAGKLRFDVLFDESGAELKLETRSPSGKTQVAQGRSSFFIEVPAAEAGEWTYTVTAVSVP